MLACCSNPIDDGLFFVPFGTCQAADTTILCDQSQGINDLILGRATAIEDGPFGFDEGTIARFAPVALATCLGLAESDDVRLVFTLQLTMIATF